MLINNNYCNSYNFSMCLLQSRIDSDLIRLILIDLVKTLLSIFFLLTSIIKASVSMNEPKMH